MSILSFANVTKSFFSGPELITAVNNISFQLREGESIALTGPSGSGKSTLLGLAAGLEKVDSGTINLLDQNLSLLSENDLADLRSKHIGFIFQSFRLLNSLTALENVEVPSKLLGREHARAEANRLLDEVGLSKRKTHYPSQLSGGEQQRVAIARAFSIKPKILLADEPSGNLDFETAEKIHDLIFSLQKENTSSLLIATHDRDLAARCDKVLSIRGGTLV